MQQNQGFDGERRLESRGPAARRRVAVWPVLAATAALLLAACGGGESGTEAEGAIGEPEPDAVVSFDGTECSSTIPQSWPAGHRVLRIEMDETMAFAIGTYKEGFGHEDMLSHAETATDVVAPAFVSVRQVLGGQAGESVRDWDMDLEPGRYFTVCLQEPSTVVVLPDLVVEG